MIQGAVLYAKNLDRLTEFYRVIGGELIDQTDGEFAIIGEGENELTILQAPEQIASRIIIEEPPVPRSQTPLKLVFKVPSLEDALDALSNRGGISFPGSKQWTFRSSLIQDIIDPEGNVVQLRQPG